MLSTSQGRPPLLFIAPRAKLAVAPSLGKTRGHRTLTGSYRTLNPQHPVLRRQPRVTSRLNSTVAANGYHALAPDTAPPDAQLVHTGRVRCTPDPCAESSANSHCHRTHPKRPVLTGLMRREGRQTARTPDAERRTLSGASGALCCTRLHTGR